MHAILCQVRANLRVGRLQSALILVSLVATATLLAVALSTLHVAQGAYDRLFERTHGAHLWLELDPAQATTVEAGQVLACLPGVEATTGVMPALPAVLLANNERLGNQLLREWPPEASTVGRPRLVVGRAPEPGEQAIVLDRNVAAWHDVEVGHTLEVLTAAGWRSLTVVGLSVNSELCPYPNCNPPRHFLAPGLMTALGLLPSPVPDLESWMVGLRLNDPAEWEAVLHAAEKQLPAGSIIDWGLWSVTRQTADASIAEQRTLLLTFSVVAGVAAGFLMANTMAESVRAQTRQIGLLKAVGFTRSQLALVYLASYLGLALVASLVGVGLGSLAAPLILRDLAARFGETLAHLPLWIVLAVPASVLLVTAIFTLWPVCHAAQMDAVQAIRGGTERSGRRAARLPHTSPSVALAMGEVLSRPRRSLLMALGLGMAALTMTAAVTLTATVNDFVSDPGLYGLDGDLFVYPAYYLPDAEVRRLIAGQPGVRAYYGTRWGSFQLQGEDEVYYLRFREGDLAAFRFPIVEGRMFEGPDEALVGYGLARQRSLHPGDEIPIVLEGQPLKLRVAGVYREPNNLGRMLMLPMETGRLIRPDLEATSYILRVQPGVEAKAVAAGLRTASGDQLEVLLAGQMGVSANILAIRGVMVLLSLLMGGIAALVTFSSVWLSVRERRREFGILKAVGMTPRQVVQAVLVAAIALAVVGYALGLLVGLPAISLLMDAMARSQGFGPLQPPVQVLGLALVLPAVVIVAVVGALIPAYHAGKLSAVDTLRYE